MLKKYNPLKFVLIVIISLFSTVSYGTHLMGGEITYTCIKTGQNSGLYVFNVIVYRDCQGIPIDTVSIIDVHNHPTLQTISLNYIESNDISPLCDTINGSNMMYSCGGNNLGYTGNGIGAVEEHVYRSDTIRIIGSPDQHGWHFTWSDCCRNGAIINIDNPNNYGFTLRTAMYPYTDSSGTVWPNNDECFDSSPSFYEKPRTILERYNGFDPQSAFNGFTYSHNAYDEELDSIAYAFAPPLDNSGYDYLNPNSIAIPFLSPYTFSAPIDSISIDPLTGRTSYPANLQGNYVTCTKVSSYRCGQLISEVFREIQVVISSPICNLGDTTNGNAGADTLCNIRPSVQPPFFYPNLSPQYQWDTIVHCGDTIQFDFIANDYDLYPNGSHQDLLFEISGGQFFDYLNNQPCKNPPCATFEEIGTGASPPFIAAGGSGGGNFHWVTDCSHLLSGCDVQGPSVFSFVIKVSDDFCPSPAIENTAQVITIIVYPSCDNLKTNITKTDATCNLNDGSVSSNPYGGTPPYNISYSDLNGASVNPDSLFAGTYIVSIIDSTLCEAIDTFIINGPNSIILSSTISDVSCFGAGDGSIDISTLNYLSYLWSNGSNNQDISFLNGGVYTLVVSDTFGCSTTQFFTVQEPQLLSVQENLNNVSCFGGNDANIDLVISGGTYPYTVIWNTGDSTEDISNLVSGSYVYSITDSNSCIYIDSAMILDPLVIQTSFVVNSVSCNGFSDGSIITSITGGTPPYSFSWNTMDTTQNLFDVFSDMYYLNVFDINGCLLIDSVMVTQPDTLQASLSLNAPNLTGSVIGGTVPYLYDFYGPTGLILSSTNASGIGVNTNVTNMGVYSFVVTDANNCQDSISVIYGNYFDPILNVSLSNLFCDSLADLTVEVSQDSGQVDMGTAIFQSNAGYFDINSLNIGDTIGTADLTAAGGSLVVNTMLVVSSIISSNQAIISPCSWANGCLGSFTITNSLNGGIEMFSQTVPDGNNYTAGNMSSITFENLFVNPCIPLIFTSVINSELGDVDSQTVVFNLTEMYDINAVNGLTIFPNPSSNIFNIELNNLFVSSVQYEVFNSVGKLIFYDNLNDYPTNYIYSLDLNEYPRGLYLLKIRLEDNILYQKLILK